MPDGDKCHGEKTKACKATESDSWGWECALLQTEQHLSNDLRKVREVYMSIRKDRSSKRSRKNIETKVEKFYVFKEHQGSWMGDMEKRFRNKIKK